MNKKYIIKNLKKVEKKIEQVYDYLDDCQTLACNERLRININRICMIDEIVSELIIELECMELALISYLKPKYWKITKK